MRKTLLQCFIASCVAATAQAQTSTGYPYFPKSSNQPITYQVFNFAGAYEPNGTTISVTTGTQLVSPNSPQKNTYSTGTCALFGMLWQGGGSAPLYLTNYYDVNGNFTGGTLQDGGGVSDSINYLGEGANTQRNSSGNLVTTVIIPFEAKLTQNPVAGEIIDTYSTVYDGCATTSTVIYPSYHWTYKTIQHLNQWGPFSDVWVTSLREHNSQISAANKDEVYNYYFAKNIGLVDLYFGHLNADNTISDGMRYFAISY